MINAFTVAAILDFNMAVYTNDFSVSWKPTHENTNYFYKIYSRLGQVLPRIVLRAF